MISEISKNTQIQIPDTMKRMHKLTFFDYIGYTRAKLFEFKVGFVGFSNINTVAYV